jgi:hypothetical protein
LKIISGRRQICAVFNAQTGSSLQLTDNTQNVLSTLRYPSITTSARRL